ncbi:hypothetical protein ACDX66_01045 [Peribacillus frigoritolerans]
METTILDNLVPLKGVGTIKGSDIKELKEALELGYYAVSMEDHRPTYILIIEEGTIVELESKIRAEAGSFLLENTFSIQKQKKLKPVHREAAIQDFRNCWPIELHYKDHNEECVHYLQSGGYHMIPFHHIVNGKWFIAE